ncbi:hypothetical protein AGMMS49983_11000 [Clostridia bacterium]|nr:hypothetical protein AGMMS49983_11000 [Clostridia bacterium]
MSDFEPTVDKAHSNYIPVFTETDNTAYCTTCNKTVGLKAGDEIPICCGRLMDLID